MSALAQILSRRGWQVSGSDRSYDRGEAQEKFATLQAAGIVLHPQDGSGVTKGLDMVIYSTAVEDSIPDIKAAKDLDLTLKHRAELLAELFHEAPLAIAIAGTSGKSTVTAMAGCILDAAGTDPAIVNGGFMINFEGAGRLGNVIDGAGPFIAETDESDGSITRFSPDVSVINNITVDHKPLLELRELFNTFIENSGSLAVNIDDPEAAKLLENVSEKPVIRYGIETPSDLQATEIEAAEWGSRFTLVDHRNQVKAPVKLNVPGMHNIYNALAATAAALLAGLSLEQAAAGLGQYKGLRRRFEIVGTAGGVTVIDDFAHNPDKIAATLDTLHQIPGRVLAIYQPHGFRPTKLLKDDLIETFNSHLAATDVLIMPEIYYAGGTAQKDISSGDIVAAVKTGEREAVFIEKRSDIVDFIAQKARPGDRVVIMGARDDTLPDFARDILSALAGNATMAACGR